MTKLTLYPTQHLINWAYDEVVKLGCEPLYWLRELGSWFHHEKRRANANSLSIIVVAVKNPTFKLVKNNKLVTYGPRELRYFAALGDGTLVGGQWFPKFDSEPFTLSEAVGFLEWKRNHMSCYYPSALESCTPFARQPQLD